MSFNADRLIVKMKEHRLHAIIAATRENVRYFAGFEPVIKTLKPYGGQCYAIITYDCPQTVHIVHSIGEIDQVLDAHSTIGHVFTYGTFYREHHSGAALTQEEEKLKQLSNNDMSYSNAEAALGALLKQLGLLQERIGFDEDGLSSNTKNNLKNQLPQAELVECASLIRCVRAVKTREEVMHLRASAQCIETAIHAVVEELYEGMNEVEIASIFAKAVAAQGGIPRLSMIKLGRHAVGGQRRQRSHIRLEPGDLLWFDCDVVLHGYWADIARVFAYKTVRPEYQKYNALRTGQRIAMREVKPGMRGKDVFHLTMNAVHEAGFHNYRRHHVGHGIGLEPYELPVLAPNSEDVIEAGMVLSIETPYYEFGLGALHTEDPIVVAMNGNEILTRSDSLFKVVG
ncbi:M24 family metallopeptidase [Paenibacillus popilliae]|uniref:Xaa-pro aminopeptidase n=1 Tax=Paenibacillus popilliae ATCC 14706 TaxID=1212764 RepID=M9LKC9_PAEPP|nr:Xaa-Pro peptidase family protein [Paenibacillus popilliae]GAC43745.1 Xaa-pro aminopeptidase [Paenibacillus popilliae ATCC 14706]